MEIALKIFGWVLLLVGGATIIWTLYFSYGILTGKTAAPELFAMPEVVTTQTTNAKGLTGIQDVQGQIEQMVSLQLKGLLPANAIPLLLNLTAWSILAFVLIFGGSQIATLGIKLLKK